MRNLYFTLSYIYNDFTLKILSCTIMSGFYKSNHIWFYTCSNKLCNLCSSSHAVNLAACLNIVVIIWRSCNKYTYNCNITYNALIFKCLSCAMFCSCISWNFYSSMLWLKLWNNNFLIMGKVNLLEYTYLLSMSQLWYQLAIC